MNKYCLHCYVSGRVQGVWFRASTQEEAQKLGLTGWVKNLSDGRVEILACGDKANVLKLHQWLQRGPRLAKVEECITEELDWQEHKNFEVMD